MRINNQYKMKTSKKIEIREILDQELTSKTNHLHLQEITTRFTAELRMME